MKHVEIIDQPDEVRELLAECEVTGRRTVFDRDGRSVAVLVSWDEYLALRETIEIANDAALSAAMRKSEAEVERGAIIQFSPQLERLRAPRWLESRATHDSAELQSALARIDDDPISGAPLFEPLKGIWSMRQGSLRVVYRIVAEARYILLLAITEVEAR